MTHNTITIIGRSLAAIPLICLLTLYLLANILPPPMPIACEGHTHVPNTQAAGGCELDYSVEILDANAERLRLYTTNAGYWRLPLSHLHVGEPTVSTQTKDAYTHTGRRSFTHSSYVDQRFIKLLMAYEDKRFYQHNGVDLLALMRATWQVITTGRLISGGSTITMQMARLLHPRPRTILAKLQEMVNAWILEHHLTKSQILAYYLTLAPYGGNIQGLRAACLFYFAKEPHFLTLAETALLIALPQAPEARRPDRYPQRAKAARDAVLQQLQAKQLVDPAEVAHATTATIPKKRYPTPILAPHASERLRRANPGVFTIRSTLKISLQRALESIVARYQSRQAPGITLAALVVENQLWKVQAYVGSGNYFATTFAGQMDMVRAIRSPGSTLKPLIYGLALEAGLVHPQTLIFDSPGAVHGYAPGNFDRRYSGEITIAEALRTSRNIPAVKLLDRIGADNLLQRLAAVGVNLRLPNGLANPGLPIALGGVGMRLEDLVQLYAGLANRGHVKTLRLQPDTSSTATLSGHSNAVLLSPLASWYLTDILASSSPPPGFTINNHHLAFKTGTSYGLRDAWAIGYNTTHTVGVWLGRTDNGYTTSLTGLQTAVPILFDIFAQLPNTGLSRLLSNKPPGVVVAQNSTLPQQWRHFDTAPAAYMNMVASRRRRGDDGITSTWGGGGVPPHLLGSQGLRITYPPPNAVVEVDIGRAVGTSGYGDVSLEITGGEYPLHLLVDGLPLIKTTVRGHIHWQPPNDGIFKLTVVDAAGHSDSVQLQVKRVKF